MSSLVPTPVNGFRYPLKGASFLARHPSLWPHVALPALLTALLYGGAAWLFFTRVGAFVDGFVQRGEAWYWALLYYLLMGFLGAVFLFITAYTYVLVGSLLFSPFADAYVARVERLATGHKDERPFNFSETIAGAGRAFVSALKRILLYLGGFALLFVLFLIPGIGQLLYALLVFPYTMFFLAWEFFDYPMDWRGYDFAAKRKAAFGNLGSFLGFGLGSWLVLLIPLLGLITVPACVAGATLFQIDLEAAGRLPSPRREESLTPSPGQDFTI